MFTVLTVNDETDGQYVSTAKLDFLTWIIILTIQQ